MSPDPLVAAATKVLNTVLPAGSDLDLNEMETRRHAIDPIIAALGYESLEHRGEGAHLKASGQFVDYLLTAGERKVVVEAKKLESQLGAKESSQLVGYCAQEGIRWAILTNGLDWHIFDTEVSGNWESKRVAKIDLAAAQRGGHVDEALHPLALFARDALATGDAELSAWSQRERARSHLDELLGNPTSSAVKAIATSMRRGGIRVSASDVVDLLRARSAAPAPVASPAPSPGISEEPAAYDPPASASPLPEAPPPRPTPNRRRRPAVPDTGVNFYLFPASERDSFSGMDHLKAWLDAGMWGLWPSTPFRRAVKPGDQCCFYAVGEGVVATAEITAPADQEVPPESWPGPTAWSSSTYALPLRDIQWLHQSIQITRELRERLDAFKGKGPSARWDGSSKALRALPSTTSTSSPAAPDSLTSPRPLPVPPLHRFRWRGG